MENDTMTKMTKMQKFEMLANLAEVQANPVLAEFVEHEMELLAKKNSSEKKPTAQQKANANLCDVIVSNMEVGKLYTVTDLQKTIPECAELTNQRISALLRGMFGSRIERVEEKRKAYFRKIAD
jgi:hypothetical protein